MSLTDVIVMGGGFSGQLTAWLLSKKGYKVAICEQEKKPGGKCRVETPYDVPVELGLHFNVLTSEQARALGIQVLFSEIRQTPPIYFQKKEWHTVEADHCSPEQTHFLLSDFVLPQGGMSSLFQYFQSENITLSCGAPVVECDIETSIIKKVNRADQAWSVDTGTGAVVMAVPFSAMLQVVDESYFHRSVLKRFKKQKMVSAVKLDFLLKENVTDLKNILFDLEHNGVGFFPSNVDPSLLSDPTDQVKQLSQWLFFLTEKEVASKEEIAKKIRAGKRGIKKAFPNALDAVLWERISVLPSLFPLKPVDQPLEKEWTSLKNLFWISGESDGPSESGSAVVSRAIQLVTDIDAYLSAL